MKLGDWLWEVDGVVIRMDERWLDVRDALKGLDQRLRRAVWVYAERMSYRAVARELGVGPKQARKLVAEGFKELRRRLGIEKGQEAR